MSLVPEKRVDRNGRLVTKHVRAARSQSPKASLPAPTAVPPKKSKKLPVARTKPRLWDVYKSQCGADPALIKASNSVVLDLNYYFEASDVEAYNVMACVSPANFIPLLACGIKTSEDAIAFLKSNNLERLIVDNAALAEQALERNLPAQSVKEMSQAFPQATIDDPTYFDAVEINGMKGYKEASVKIPKLILDGKINIDDLKTVGVAGVKAGGAYGVILRQLEKINSGTSTMDAEELSQIIKKVASSSASHPAFVNEAIRLADRRGVELAMRIEDTSSAERLDNSLLSREFSPSKVSDILIWNDQVNSGVSLGYVPLDQLIELFEAGIQPKDAAEGLSQKLHAHQIIGIHRNGIQPAVSGGWL